MDLSLGGWFIFVCFIIGPQDRIHPGLIAPALGFTPFQNIGIEPDGDLFFGGFGIDHTSFAWAAI